MNKQNKLKIVIPVLLLSSAAFILFKVKNDSLFTNRIDNSDSSQSNSLEDQDISTIDFQQLSILGNKCRGCGRCVQIDPSHFEMDGRVATIISSDNLDSSSLALAINNCPTQAIVLE